MYSGSNERSTNASTLGLRPIKFSNAFSGEIDFPTLRIFSTKSFPVFAFNKPSFLKRVNASASKTSAHLYD